MASGLIGYFDALSVGVGHTLGLKLSSKTAESCTLSLWRVRGVKWTDSGVAPTLDPVAHEANGTHACQYRKIPAGSYGTAPAPQYLAQTACFSFGLWVQPTAKHPARAALFSLEGDRPVTLGLDDAGAPTIWQNGQPVVTGSTPLRRGVWSLLICTFADDQLTLSVQDMQGEVWAGMGVVTPLEGFEEVRFAARKDGDQTTDHFDGRLEAPTLATVSTERLATAFRQGTATLGPACIAAWEFSARIDSQTIIDTGPEHCHGKLRNRPTRGVTGVHWDGSAFDWSQTPRHYGAIHFHSDDLDDCGWPNDVTLNMPEDMKPGIYAVRVENAGGRDLIPFVVRARADKTRPKLAFLLPTFTYLSYGNAQNAMRGPDFGVDTYLDEQTLAAHRELGRSQYDLHSDRSPVMFSSPQRPLMSMRFGVRPWGLPVDAAMLGFLEHLGQDYDVLTDADLHREGAAALADYDCVITGNHPEYYSAEMLDAVQAFTHRGGRVMYLGGNGFYWRVTVCPNTGTIEVRRAEDGTRAWMSAPGEAFHAMDGGYGGLWRRLGRAPNKLVDVGFAAQGDFDISGYYMLRDGVRDGAGAFALAGLKGDSFGDYGWLGNGAAGQEIDRADVTLGTSPDTVILASSTGHTPAMMRTIEEMLSTVPPFKDPKARADVTFRALAGGGAIFAVGSMTWMASIDHEGFDNDVARITENVIARFLDPAPFEGAKA